MENKRLAFLMLTALGVVYGDIGTSPLYAVKEAFNGAHALPILESSVFGLLSLIFWSLVLVVIVKYMTFIMRADNQGEGGILALLALLARGKGTKSPRLLLSIGLFGAALLYGDGMITPAISVLSAMEGLEFATDRLTHWIIPLTIIVLVFLFFIQAHGTARVGTIFGPVMLAWFVTMAILGIGGILRYPRILHALSPHNAVEFMLTYKKLGFLSLGAVVLAVTGAEALYADLGHFGIRPIKYGWYSLVFPSLTLNYLGQGALLLSQPDNLTIKANPFYSLVPQGGLYPMVALATMATIIASQALISGSFSLTQQAIQLGYLPRLRIVHTSESQYGQIYIPMVNKILAICCIALVLYFQSSSDLAAAYGIAVIGTMGITSILFYFVTRSVWGWSRPKAALVSGFFLIVELVYLGANIPKLFHGGWVSLVVAGVIYTVKSTWYAGRKRLAESFRDRILPLEMFVDDLNKHPITRVPGTAVFLSSNPHGTPPILLHHIRHNKALHERILIVTMVSTDTPYLPAAECNQVEVFGNGLYRIIARHGFMETPNIPQILENCNPQGLKVKPREASYYLGHETLLVTGSKGMMRPRKQLFAFLSRNARPATEFFGIPPNRVVEFGMQVEI